MSIEKIESESIAKTVRELMERHGIGERKQTSELGRILNLGFSAAHRKMNGDSPWTVSQIILVANHFNERPGTLLDSLVVEGSAQASTNSVHEAMLNIKGRDFPCTVQIGVLKNKPTSFVAFERYGEWHVIESKDAPVEFELFNVEKIEIYPDRIHNLTIAVVDDDPGTADNIRDYLIGIGFKSKAFYDIPAAVAAIQADGFDGYILDWFVGSETSEVLLNLIRKGGQQEAPIILLTGQMLTGKIDDTEVAGLMRRFDVICQEKPVRLPILAAEVMKMLDLN